MKTTITIIVAALAVSTACADEPTFDSIQDEFRQKAISLLSERESSAKEFQSKVAEIASTTFGSNPNVMKKEAASRFKRLPPFPVEGLTGFIEHKSWDQFSLPPAETGLAWIIFAYEPKNIADLAKKAILGRNLTPDQLSRRAFVAACCP